MPPVVAGAALGAILGAAGLVTATVLGSTILAGALIYGGLAAASYLLQPDAPSLPSLSGSSGTTKSTIKSALTPRRWALGRTRLSGVLAFAREAYSRESDFWIVLLLSEGSCVEIQRLWSSGEKVEFTRSADGVIQGTGDWQNRITIWEEFDGLGSTGGAGPTALRAACADWTTDHQLKGISHVIVRLRQSNYGAGTADVDLDDRFWTAVPDLSFLLKGMKITWPGQAVATWTENAAAIRYWWMRNRRGIPDEAIFVGGIGQAVAVCGHQVTVMAPTGADAADYPATEARYAINGTVLSGMAVEQVEAEFDWCWQGHVVEIDGVHHFRPGAERAPILDLGADDIMSLEALRAAPSLQDRVNAAHIRISQSWAHDWSPLSLPEFVDPEQQLRDGERYPLDLGERQFEASPTGVIRKTAVYMRRARASAVFTYRVQARSDLRWLGVLPTDRLRLTDPSLGLENFLVVIHGVTVNPDWSVTLQLEEAPDGIYSDTLYLGPLRGRGVAGPGSRLPPLAPVFENTTPSFVAFLTADGQVHTDVIVEVTPSAYAALRVTITGPEGFEDTKQIIGRSRVVMAVPTEGDYTVKAQYVSNLDITGPAVTADLTINWDNLVSTAPTGCAVEELDDGTRSYSWDVPMFRNLAGIVIRYGPAGQSWENMTPLHEGVLTFTPHEAYTPDEGTWDFLFRAQTRTGVLSPSRRCSGVVLGLPRGHIDRISPDITALVDEIIMNNPAFQLATEEANRARAAADEAAASALMAADEAADAELARSAAAGSATASNTSAMASSASASQSGNSATASASSSSSASTSAANAAAQASAAATHSMEASRLATVAGDRATASATSATLSGVRATSAANSATAAAGSAAQQQHRERPHRQPAHRRPKQMRRRRRRRPQQPATLQVRPQPPPKPPQRRRARLRPVRRRPGLNASRRKRQRRKLQSRQPMRRQPWLTLKGRQRRPFSRATRRPVLPIWRKWRSLVFPRPSRRKSTTNLILPSRRRSCSGQKRVAATRSWNWRPCRTWAARPLPPRFRQIPFWSMPTISPLTQTGG